jgi:NAD(P)-dependent dehydrogenase (short-subunit alcohol dehydrogenase family)
MSLSKTILITGCSTGIGYASAVYVLALLKRILPMSWLAALLGKVQ